MVNVWVVNVLQSTVDTIDMVHVMGAMKSEGTEGVEEVSKFLYGFFKLVTWLFQKCYMQAKPSWSTS